ncbi:MAG: DegT/DnrJ/EryC1/StrS family aminotransferase [Planctomycetes bacterium]|nr:DegT/DnrJ/EryC1/StrS family aminotransferase [Planctomycetota bacterium]
MTKESSVPASPKKNIPMLDVGRGNQPLRDAFLDAVAKVIDSGRFLHGPEVGELECAVAGVCGTKHAIGCASGSDALLLALMALDVQPGDEVIVPSFTFFATASAVARLGAEPVFVDIDPETFNIDPQSVADSITSRTRAIIPVHLFGQCASMDTLQEIASKHRLPIIEDAAQAIGAAWRGRPAGSMGLVGCLSFYPTKNLGGMGDGGMMVCHDDEFAARLRLLAAHGMQPRYHHKLLGINSRLDTLQAAVLTVKLAHLDAYSEARQKNADRYTELFRNAQLHETIQLPHRDPRGLHVWNQYGIRVPYGRRDALKQHLAGMGIGSEIYYPVPLHMQECFADLGYSLGCLPNTESAAREILHLPVYPELTEQEQDAVVEGIESFYMTGAFRRAA